MNWVQKLFFKAAGARAFRFLPEWVRSTFLPVSLRRLLDGYHKNSAVSACVTTLAFSFPEPPLLAGYEQPDGRFVPDYSHPIMKLIRQPNKDMGEVELMQFVITYASIGGNLYLWKQRRVNNQVMALWPFSDVNITPVPGSTTEEGFVKGYLFDDGSGHQIPIPKEDIIHWKWMPDPEQPWRGIGAIEFAIRDSDRDSEASAYIYALLKNNAVPPVVVTLAEGDDFDEEKAKRLRANWNQKLGGENRGQLAFLEFGMKAEKMGFDLQQLAGEALNAVPEARIAASFRTPPVVAGLSVGLKRSDYGDAAARRAFTELTLAALWRSFASELFNGLTDDFGLARDGVVLQFDLRKVRALQEEESKRWERVTLAFDRGGITRWKMKEMLGLETVAGDKVYKVSLATEFVPEDGDGVVDRTALPAGKSQKDADLRQVKSQAAGRGLQRIRLDVARRMTQAVDVYFSQLADRVIERAGKNWPLQAEQKDLPSAGELLNGDDRKKLETLVKRFYVEITQLSWEMWNLSLGVEKAFDLEDPIITRILKMAEIRVKDIHENTLISINELLIHGNENGWSIDQLVRGDPENGFPGLRELVVETYKDRARVIARTELGEAQNFATARRYSDAGVNTVEILDNGSTDDDQECKDADGQIWTLEYFSDHSLEHPNCTRAAAPYFGNVEPDRG